MSLNKNMKILHVVISLAPKSGGPTKVVHELTEVLVEKGVEVAVFARVQIRRQSKDCPAQGGGFAAF